MLAIVPETGREVNGGCESAQKGRKKPLFWGRGGGGGVFSYAVGTAGNFGLPSRGPISWEEMGKEPLGEEVPPRDPLLWWGGVGEAVLLSWYLACGPHIERPVTARPPAGRAGDVGGCPLGEGREEPFGFPLSPPVNKPLLPPARAGGRAMRRWSWRPQARPIPTQPPSPVPLTREWGSKGRNLLPLGVLSPISSKK